MTRTYRQHCALARALDLVGERWTLLVARELLAGPKRYKDLQEGLPSIGTGMLAARLKELEREGVIRRRTLPPPAGSTVYELTELGRELESTLVGLTRFGQHWLRERRPGDSFRPGWCALAFRARFDAAAASGVRESYELHLAGAPLQVHVADGRAEVLDGEAPSPVCVMRADEETCFALGTSELPFYEAIESGRLEVEGDREAALRFAKMFPPASTSAALA